MGYHGELEPVKAAASTGQNLALPTLVDVVRKSVVTLFTLVAAATRPPGRMLALVILHQIGHLPSHQICPLGMGHLLSPDVSVYDDVGAVQQPSLVPLVTSAPLPNLAADIAELGATTTSYWWRGRIHC